VRLGCEVGRCREADAVFEVREEEVYVASCAADEAAGVFGVGEITAPLANRYAADLNVGEIRAVGSQPRLSLRCFFLSKP
jgi:hypothetical protein